MGSLFASSDQLLLRLPVVGIAGFLFGVGFKVFPATATSALAVVVGLTCYATAFLLVAWALAGRLHVNSAQRLVLAAFLLGVCAAVGYGILFEIPTYGTDVMSFAHASADGLLDGRNPYELTIDEMRPLLDSVGFHDGLLTPTADGRPLERILYYPAGHVLAFVPFRAAGLSDLRWVTLLAEIIALGLIWSVTSPISRLFLPLIVVTEPYLASVFTAGGNSDWLWVLPLVAAAITLNRGEISWSGFWLGIACAVKQQPWFALPFFLIYLWKLRGDLPERSMRHGALMLAIGFLVPNLPFILWNPVAWLEGVLGPMSAAPAGQGVSLLTSQGWFDIPTSVFSLLLAAVGTAAVVGYWRYFTKWKNLLWILPAMILFFSHRSLHNYFIYWLPVTIVWMDLEVRKMGVVPWEPTSAPKPFPTVNDL